MKFKLLGFKRPVIVSTEEIKEPNFPIFVVEKLTNGRYEIFQIDTANELDIKTQWKIIAGLPGLPGIDFSGLSKFALRKIGHVDTYELFKKIDDSCEKDQYAHWLFDEGFKAGLDRVFSEEEARLIWYAGQEYSRTSGSTITFEELIERRNQLLNSTILEFDVELLLSYCACQLRGSSLLNKGAIGCMERNRCTPELIDGKIKIVKIGK